MFEKTQHPKQLRNTTYLVNRSDEDLLSRELTHKIVVSKVSNFILKRL